MGYLLSRPLTLVLDVAVWAIIHAATGYLVHRLAARRFDGDWWIHRARRLELDGELYVRWLRIKRWKRLLPEAGALFSGGFDKRELGRPTRPRLEDHRREARRAELGHWLCLAGAPLFVFWNPWPIALVMIGYALVANGPFIAATRYNRIRLDRVLARKPRSLLAEPNRRFGDRR